MVVCPVCFNEKANRHPTFGILPGDKCKRRRENDTLPDAPVEMVGESIKGERIEFAKSIIQPRNSRGELSREYLTAYGTKGIKASEQEVKNARNIWDGAISNNIDITKAK